MDIAVVLARVRYEGFCLSMKIRFDYAPGTNMTQGLHHPGTLLRIY
jgi:hypothetical protein